MSVRPYPSYQESGVEWLGGIPSCWSIKPIWAVATCNDDVLGEDTPDDFRMNYIEISDIDPIEGIRSSTELEYATAPSRARRLVIDGDVIVSTVRTYLRAIAAVKTPSPHTVVSTGFAAFRARKIDSAFLAHLFHAEFLISQIIARSVGVSYPAINANEITHLKIPVPSPAEQSAIAIFLDRETRKIDALVAEQERLIALLKEKRQAVISQVVTKGLNPSAPMKPSGVEWLGDVPAHWDVTPLKWLTDPQRPIMYGIVLPGPDVGEGVPILKGGNVKPSRMNLENMARTTVEIEAPFARARLKAGDLVYAIRGTIGDCEPVPVEMAGANITQDVARVAIASGVCAAWARWALLSSAVREELASGSLGAAVRGVNIFDLKRVKIPTPPYEEQVAIADFIGREVGRLDELADEAHRAVGLLNERRAALISAAVTGKIDVRGLVDAPSQAA